MIFLSLCTRVFVILFVLVMSCNSINDANKISSGSPSNNNNNGNSTQDDTPHFPLGPLVKCSFL